MRCRLRQERTAPVPSNRSTVPASKAKRSVGPVPRSNVGPRDDARVGEDASERRLGSTKSGFLMRLFKYLSSLPERVSTCFALCETCTTGATYGATYGATDGCVVGAG